MRVPIAVTYRDVPKTANIDSLIRRKASKLERVCDHIDSCRVAIERPNRSQRTGTEYTVRIDMTVPPGHELVVRRSSHIAGGPDDLHRAVHEAFDAAKRRLQRVSEVQRGRVKNHPEQSLHAVIDKLFDDYGFIRTVDNREVYFHRNSVVSPRFEQLRVGAGVAFTETPGDDGPQASSVRLVDRRGQPGRRRESL